MTSPRLRRSLLAQISLALALSVPAIALAGTYEYQRTLVPVNDLHDGYDDVFTYREGHLLARRVGDPVGIRHERNRVSLVVDGRSGLLTLHDSAGVAPYPDVRNQNVVPDPTQGNWTADLCSQPDARTVRCKVPFTWGPPFVHNRVVDLRLGKYWDVAVVHGWTDGIYVEGGVGNDRLTGTKDAPAAEFPYINEYLSGGAGNDTIDARNGLPDHIDCGPGDDHALVDGADVDVANCEIVEVG